MVAWLALLGVGGGIAAVLVSGHQGAASKKPVRPAHGLMLFPRADPDAHAQNGAESIDSAR